MEVETLRTAVSVGRGSSFVAVTSQVPVTPAVTTALLIYRPVVVDWASSCYVHVWGPKNGFQTSSDSLKTLSFLTACHFSRLAK